MKTPYGMIISCFAAGSMRLWRGLAKGAGDAGWLIAGKQGGKWQKSENSTAFGKKHAFCP